MVNLTVICGAPVKPVESEPVLRQTGQQPHEVAAIYEYLTAVFAGTPCNISLVEGVMEFGCDESQFDRNDPGIVYAKIIPFLQREFEGLVVCLLDVADNFNRTYLGFTPPIDGQWVSFVMRRRYVQRFKYLVNEVRDVNLLMLTSLHEVLHTLGLNHCLDSQCLMRSAFENGVAISTDTPSRDMRQLLCDAHLRELQERFSAS